MRFWGAWRLLVLVHCVLSCPKSMQPFYQEILEHFMLPSADKLYRDADFHFQQDFSTCPQCLKPLPSVGWPWYYCTWLASQHAWPEPHMQSIGYFQEKDEKQSIQQYRWEKKELFHNILIFEMLLYLYNPKSEKVGTVWKTQIKKERSDF